MVPPCSQEADGTHWGSLEMVQLGSRFIMWFLSLYLPHDVGEHKSVVSSHRLVEKQACLAEV